MSHYSLLVLYHSDEINLFKNKYKFYNLGSTTSNNLKLVINDGILYNSYVLNNQNYFDKK